VLEKQVLLDLRDACPQLGDGRITIGAPGPFGIEGSTALRRLPCQGGLGAR
jgi:hypothetical protein